MQRQVCPTCALDEFVVAMENDDGGLELSCTECVFSWEPKIAASASFGRSGHAADLGIYEDLLACVPTEPRWTEHGVVEHRFKLMRPQIYAELLARYGHHADGSNTTYSVSKFLAGAMTQLDREGLLVTHRAKATGYWSYLSAVSYRSRAPEPEWDARLTWQAFAVDEGLDPMAWELGRPTGG